MTSPVPVTSDDMDALHAAAAEAGLTVISSASWPETEADDEVTPLAGFIESNFSPLIAEVAERALSRRAPIQPHATTAIVMVTNLGDVTSAARVAAAVDAGRRVSPLLFFQSVPNSVAGYLAARWRLTGPVVCVSGTTAGLEAAALLIDDGDTGEALIVRVELAVTDGGARDHAAAVLVTGPTNQEGP
ncbi:MAG TPA: beta-ketoacyl synthase chain length factor [Streptosporangiaceae bacterium]